MSLEAALTVALRVTERFTGLTSAIIVTPGAGQFMLLVSIMEHDMPIELFPMATGAAMDGSVPPPPQLPRSSAAPPRSGSDVEESALRSRAAARM